jgi:hypothetical protein
MPMLQKNMTIISSLVSLGTLVGLLGTVAGMIKAFVHLLLQEHQIKQLLQLVFLKRLLIRNWYWNFSCSNYLLQLLY